MAATGHVAAAWPESLTGRLALSSVSRIFCRCVLFRCGLVLHLLPMMLNNAPCGRSYYGVMAGHVADHAADCRAFQAAFGAGNP